MPKVLDPQEHARTLCDVLGTCTWCEGPMYCCDETHGQAHLSCAESAHDDAMDALDREPL